MITTSIAHPCVILHAFFNEGPSVSIPSVSVSSVIATPPTNLSCLYLSCHRFPNPCRVGVVSKQDNATACKHGYKPSADLIRSLVGTPPSR